MMGKVLPRNVTSYDLLKTLAVLLMIVDHIGVYFFPDDLWWRAVGRMSAPIWLFLIGYARSRDLSPRLWAAAGVLTVSNLFVATAFFPLTILLGMILVRLCLDRAVSYFFASRDRVFLGGVLSIILVFPTFFVIDYGILCLIVAIYGYFVRFGEDSGRISAQKVKVYGVFAFVLYSFVNVLGFGFTDLQALFVITGCAAVFALLFRFQPREYDGAVWGAPAVVQDALRFCGRRTLEIYVGHILLFKALACFLGLSGFGLFEWTWF